jgi:hypothetical protein
VKGNVFLRIVLIARRNLAVPTVDKTAYVRRN